MRWVLVAAFALGGCPGPSDPEPDASTPGDVGIRLGWKTVHPNTVPGPAKAGTTITSVKFSLTNVRVIGDIAPDPRTQVQRLELAWSEGVSPQAQMFVDAPPGIYSRVGFKVSTEGEIAYEITGTTKIENVVDVPFRIVDRGDVDVSVMHERAPLSPGGAVDMNIRLDFEKVLDEVDFAELPLVEGVRVLNESGSQIQDVREAIQRDLFRDGDDDIN